jgi:hypothetical protein
MRMLKAFHLLAVVGAVCLMAAAGAEAREAGSRSAMADATSAPLSLEEAWALPDLQPRTGIDLSGSRSEHASNSITYGNWQYEMGYVRVDGNWRFDRYTVTRVDESESSDSSSGIDKNSAASAKPLIFGALGGGSTQLPDGPLPPDASTNPDMPLNPPPDKNRTQTSTHLDCGYGGGSYDLYVEYTWVPEHTVTNRDGSTTVIPGQWVLKTYTAMIGYKGC